MSSDIIFVSALFMYFLLLAVAKDRSIDVYKDKQNRRTIVINGSYVEVIEKQGASNRYLLRTLSLNAPFNQFKPDEVEYFTSLRKVKVLAKRSRFSQESLNSLQKALLVHPFKTWKLKYKFTSMEDIRIHEKKLHAVIDNKRNERLKRKLYKVLQGEDIYLDIFGGSNTAGGGFQSNEGGTEGIYPKVVGHWWDKTIAPITGSHLKLRQIAIGGTSSDFFQFCFASYIHKQLDLVFIEMAVNDLETDLPINASKCTPLEQLTRQLLMYGTEPALVYINLFSGSRCQENCVNLYDYGQGILTERYNITSLNWRDAVCSKGAGIGCDLIASDGNHINQLGHAHISLMIINLIRRILWDHIFLALANSHGSFYRARSFTRVGNQVPRETSRLKNPLPSPWFIKKTSNVISEPLCWTSLKPNYQNDAIKNNLNLRVIKTNGFHSENNRIGGNCKRPCRTDNFNGWTAHTAHASTTVSFKVPRRISTDRINTRSVIVAYRQCWLCGAALVWLDNDYEKNRYIDAKHYDRTKQTIVSLAVKPGKHTLSIKVLKEGMVAIVGIMIGPPDGPY